MRQAFVYTRPLEPRVLVCRTGFEPALIRFTVWGLSQFAYRHHHFSNAYAIYLSLDHAISIARCSHHSRVSMKPQWGHCSKHTAVLPLPIVWAIAVGVSSGLRSWQDSHGQPNCFPQAGHSPHQRLSLFPSRTSYWCGALPKNRTSQAQWATDLQSVGFPSSRRNAWNYWSTDFSLTNFRKRCWASELTLAILILSRS